MQGVNMNDIWKKVGKQQKREDYYDLVCGSTLEALGRGEEYRSHFHEVVSHGVVWSQLFEDEIPRMLYTVRDCLGVPGWHSRNEAPIYVSDHFEPEEIG